MKIQAIKELYNQVADSWSRVDRNVSHIHGEAEDNAIAAIRENGGSAWVDGTSIYTEEFYTYYILSLETLLACSDIVTEEGRKFFEQAGVKY